MSTSTFTPTFAQEQAFAREFLSFINASPSHFHAVATSAAQLVQAGFTQIAETDDWRTAVQPGGKYFFTRNQSSIVAFAVPKSFVPGAGFVVVGAHTDSPVLKLKPVSRVTKHGFLQVGVQPYGGGLWYTWFDRDLSVAGRVIMQTASGFESRLVHIQRPILNIPSLAIHLNREVTEKGFAPNKQTHVLPILSSVIKNELQGGQGGAGTGASSTASPTDDRHHSLLVSLLAKELGVSASQIVDFELSLFDTHAPRLGGAHEEFIFSRALDNLLMSFVSLRALIDSVSGDAWNTQSAQIRVCTLFDNEEVGSTSWQGANSTLMSRVLERLNNDAGTLDAALRRTLVVSADMAHALHPNYAELHEENHRPALHKGLVVKENANQRYATSSLTAFAVTQIAKQHGIPIQTFVVRNDVMCGSTIGPLISANTGVRTVDVGVPQFSMHSIRETCGVSDVLSAHRLLTHVYQQFAEFDAKLVVDGAKPLARA